MGTTWQDIQRLAQDLQKVQQSTSKKKLCEANCIEVVSKLIAGGLINVVFTRDGRSYVTLAHLETEIKDECLARGGRVELTEIVASLNIDFDHIDRIANALIKSDSTFVLSNGELFSSTYVDRLSSLLAAVLKKDGSCTVDKLCKQWDLSRELLYSLFLDKLGDDSEYIVDGDIVFTANFLKKCIAELLAMLVAVSRPTFISEFQENILLPTKRFWAIYDEIISSGEVEGRITGSRTSPHCTFVPKSYDDLVNTFISNSFRQNQYLALSFLRQFSLSDSKNSIENVLGTKSFVSLPTLIISEDLFELCMTAIKDVVTSEGICEAQSALEANMIPFDLTDIDSICEKIAASEKTLNAADGYVFSSELLKKSIALLNDKIEAHAHEEISRLEKEKTQSKGGAKKPVADDDDWADNKKGGKKKGKGGGAKGGKTKDEDAPKGSGTISSISQEILEDWLKETSEIPEALICAVSELSIEQINDKFHKRVSELAVTQQSNEAQSQKRSLAALQANAQNIYTSICTFAASSSSFTSPLCDDLRIHLVKTLGGELSSVVLSFVSGTDNCGKLSEKNRLETVNSLPSGQREAVTALFDASKASDLDALHSAIETVSSKGGCGMLIKRPDDKSVSEFVKIYEKELESVLRRPQEPAATLLTAVLLLSCRAGRPITATGKFVQRLIGDLQEHIPSQTYTLLGTCQTGVVACIKSKDDEIAQELLNSDIQKLLEILLS